MNTLQQLNAKLNDLIQFNIEAEAGSWLAKSRLMRGSTLTRPVGGAEGFLEKAKRLSAIKQANTKFQKVGWNPGMGY